MRRAILLSGLALLYLALGPPGAFAEEKAAAPDKPAADKAAAKEVVFKLEEASVLERWEGEMQDMRQVSGQYVRCTTEPSKQVKAYPKLNSKKPLYGTATFDANPVAPGAGIKFHFVLDESGETPKGEEKKEGDKKKSSLLEALSKSLQGAAIKEVSPPMPRYDRLYIDLNRDLDLTNDPVVTLLKEPPKDLPQRGRESVVFGPLSIPFDLGPGAGVRPTKILPQLLVFGPEAAYLDFMATTVRRGKIRIGKEEYFAVLSQSTTVAGRFDRGFTQLALKPVETPKQPVFYFDYGANWLGSMREVDGQLYALSATPTGDQLTVKPYRGDFGVLEIGPGKREIKDEKKLGAVALLASDKQAIVGKFQFPVPEEKPRQIRLPVGDYVPIRMAVNYGNLGLTLASLRDADDGTEEPARPAVFPLKIRKDKPFVLDFPGKPAVVFNSPRPGQKLKPGDMLRLEALLTDPSLGVMIAGLEDISRKVGEVTTRDREGKEIKVPRYASLDPIVTIKNSAGEVLVTDGKMPFG